MHLQDFASVGTYDTASTAGRAFAAHDDQHQHPAGLAERWVVGGWITGGSKPPVPGQSGSGTRWRRINSPTEHTTSRIVNSTVRNNGDDGFAMWSTTTWAKGRTSATCSEPHGSSDLCARRLRRHGGHDNVIQDSYVYRHAQYVPGSPSTTSSSAVPFSGTTTSPT